MYPHELTLTSLDKMMCGHVRFAECLRRGVCFVSESRMVRESLTVAYRACGGGGARVRGELRVLRLVRVNVIYSRGGARGVVSPSKRSSLVVEASVASLPCGC